MIKKINFILTNLFIAIIILTVGEIALRLYENLKFNSSSDGLLIKNENQKSYFNAPNFKGYSFGEEVFIDNNGFRVPYSKYEYPEKPTEKILILGDSVAFGAGIMEENTFVGMLRKKYNKKNITNTAVNGYNFDDYINVAKNIINQDKFNLGILVICLNDIISFSNSITNAKEDSELVNIVENSRNSKFLLNINNFLRQRSKLYLFVKGLATDPSYRYFMIDSGNYKNNINSRLNKISEINKIFIDSNTPLIVIISPYEYQLRVDHNNLSTKQFEKEIFFPQILLKDYMESKNINFFDPFNYFKEASELSDNSLFISFDPMHLSNYGNEAMFSYIDEIVFN